MPAKALKFQLWLQWPMDEGVITPRQAWDLFWTVETSPSEPLPPPLTLLAERLNLFYQEQGQTPVQ